MPNTYTTLSSLFTDIANAIRSKTGGSAQIVADDFPTEIANIPSGGAVDSVNGKTGDVVLTASDVGALADNTPIPNDLSDLSDVDTSGVTDGQILKYNSTSGKFLPSNESGGGTTDYTDLTNKPSVNGVTLSGNKTSADLGISGGSNENLLLNPWFQVNSKGITSGTPERMYSEGLDEWLWDWGTTAGTYSWSSSGITLTSQSNDNMKICQYLTDINDKINGKTITVSLMLSNGTVYSGSITKSSSAQTVFNTSGVMADITSANLLRFRVTNGSITIKAVKLELGSTSTISLDAKPNYNEDLMKLGYISGNSNRNLLDNAWFTVNQKGVTSGTTTSWFKTLDRWEIASASTSYSLDSNGLQLTFSSGGSASITQYSEDFVNLVGKQLTASIMFSNGNVTSGTVTLTSDANTTFINDGNVRIRYLKESGNVRTIQFTIYNSATIRAVKLEIGSQSTLAYDTAPDYTTELLKCQRYLYRITSATQCYIGMAGNTSTNLACWFVNLPTPMRTTPTISTGGTIKLVKGGTEVSVTSIATNLSGASDILSLGITPSSALDVNSSYLVKLSGNSYIDFDAQL